VQRNRFPRPPGLGGVDEGEPTDGGAGAAPASELEGLDGRVGLQWGVRLLVLAAVLGAVAGGATWALDGALDRATTYGAYATGAALALGALYALLYFRSWGFRVRTDSLYLQRGVLVRVETLVPHVRLQHVDTRRSALERALGLGTVVVYTAGSTGADVSVPGMARDRARRLQATLKDRAKEAGGDDAV